MLLLVAGHTELWVTFVNRVHANRIHDVVLRKFRLIHDVMVPGFPIVFVWFAGIRGTGLLFDGHWTELPTGWRVYLGVCAVGVVGLVVAIARHFLNRPPNLQLSNHSITLDFEEKLGYRPAGKGHYDYLLRVPGNQSFELEVSQKSYRLPRLPHAWDGLSILHLTDLHLTGVLDRVYYEEVMKCAAAENADVIVFSGDLLDEPELLEWIPGILGGLKAPLGCYYILGNHDWYLDTAAIRDCLQELGWQDVAGTCVTIEHRGHQLAIGGTELPWMGRHPDFSEVKEDAFRLLLSHTPDNIPWARQNQVDLMLSGHNHGGQVVLPVFGPVYSPSRFGCRYAGGVFWEKPTLLYVSRGIGGRHPLRLNCRPELTTLVLRAPQE